MISNTFSKHDKDFADAMATKLRLNKEKNKRNLTADEKINKLTAEQKKEIGGFRFCIYRSSIMPRCHESLLKKTWKEKWG